MDRRDPPSLALCGGIDHRLCMGCGICAGVCPREALLMNLDERLGAYLPVYISDRCNGCGICRKACPGYETDLGGACKSLWGEKPEDPRVGQFRSAVIAYSNNDTIRYNGSSGGMVTGLLIHALEAGMINGALVTRMREDIPWMTEAFIAHHPEEILSGVGSKYCPVSMDSAIRQMIHCDGKYAVVGLPCHIYGIRKAQALVKSLRERVVFTFGLFCATGRSYKGTEAFLLQAGIRSKTLKSIRYRGAGWPGVTKVVDLSGRSVRCSVETAYPFMCFNDIPRCAVCPDKTSELADISFGDLWLGDERPNMGTGKSVCLVRSQQGAVLFEHAQAAHCIAAVDLDPSRTIEAVDNENKKRRAAARIAILKWLGRPVPVIANAIREPIPVADLILGLQYFILQRACRYAFLRSIYFFVRPNYRKLRAKMLEKT
ncbi:MAG: Coenzyme F420 hydrogenase/dehydrogenase, beta subunit C-terminal domain [Pseudomonadota bacterium]